MNKLPLDGRSKEQQIEEAKRLLMENGYLVRGPLLCPARVRTPSDLVRFFYDKMVEYNPGYRMAYSGSKKRDLDIAKKFIASRQVTGISKKRALFEACTLIDCLFKYEDCLNLHSPITSTAVLGQDNMAWVTEKLIDICNGFNRTVNREEDQRWFDAFYRYQEDHIDEKQVRRAEQRLGMEHDNGKKEG